MDKEDVNVKIGRRLKAAREEVGFSQMAIARILGYESATAVALIEKGARKLKAEDLQKLADLLGYEVGYFLGQAPEEVPTVKMALRADGELTNKDREAIMHFIDIAKKRNEKR